MQGQEQNENKDPVMHETRVLGEESKAQLNQSSTGSEGTDQEQMQGVLTGNRGGHRGLVRDRE